MEYQIEKKSAPGRKEVEVLGATFAKGRPEGEGMGRWRQKLASREEKLKYLETAEKYWYGKELSGSGGKKGPA